MNEYLQMLPRGHRFASELLFDGGGGGGGQTTQTQAQMMPWSKYVPKETYEAYKRGLVYAGSRAGEGLTPEESQQYTGEILSNTANQFAGAEKGLKESLARSGVQGGAVAESLGDLERSKAFAGAAGLSGLAAQDIQEKRKNLEEARRWVGLPGSPIQTGSTSTTTSSGGGS